jgi:hypothetical protein
MLTIIALQPCSVGVICDSGSGMSGGNACHELYHKALGAGESEVY